MHDVKPNKVGLPEPHPGVVSAFISKFTGPVLVLDQDKLRHCNSEQVFLPEDIAKSDNDLDRLARTLLVKNNVSLTEFRDRFNQYAVSIGLYPTLVSSRCSNTLRALWRGKLSIRSFYVVCGMMNYKIRNFQVCVEDELGKLEVFRTADGFSPQPKGGDK